MDSNSSETFSLSRRILVAHLIYVFRIQHDIAGQPNWQGLSLAFRIGHYGQRHRRSKRQLETFDRLEENCSMKLGKCKDLQA